MSAAELTPVALTFDGTVRNLLRTQPIAAGSNIHGQPMTVHVEISGDPPPHGPDEMQPTVCINLAPVSSDPYDTSWIDIDDPISLRRLIGALTAAETDLLRLRKEAGL